MPRAEPDPREAMERVVEDIADQSVYVYAGSVMIAHLPPNTRWNFVGEPPTLQLLSWSTVRNCYAVAAEFPYGEYTYVGRGHPNDGVDKELGATWLTGKGPTPELVEQYKRNRKTWPW